MTTQGNGQRKLRPNENPRPPMEALVEVTSEEVTELLANSQYYRSSDLGLATAYGGVKQCGTEYISILTVDGRGFIKSL